VDETSMVFRNAQCIFLDFRCPIAVWVVERMLMKCINSFLIHSCAVVNLYNRQYDRE